MGVVRSVLREKEGKTRNTLINPQIEDGKWTFTTDSNSLKSCHFVGYTS